MVKCYNCGHNEADSRLLVNYMGHSAEVYLCTGCLEGFKEYATSILKEAREKGSMPFAQPYAWPNFELKAPEHVVVGKTGGDAFPLDAGEEIKCRRRLGELREKLRAAVQAEDYETAAALRDEIYRMEKGVCV